MSWLCVILQVIKMIHQHSRIMLSKSEPCHKHKQDPSDIAWHRPYLKVLYNAYALLLRDNFMDISNMATRFMEPRKRIITLYNNYCFTSLIQSAVGILLNSRNAAIASKPIVACGTTVHRNYSEHVLHTHLPLIISASIATWYLLLCLYSISSYSVHDDQLYWTVLMLILGVLCMNGIW